LRFASLPFAHSFGSGPRGSRRRGLFCSFREGLRHIGIIANARATHTRASEVLLIIGLGLDISEIDRIEAAITRHGTAILQRLYTPQEIAYCESFKNKFERYAGRFAAKEAGMKALGTGWRRGVRWRDLEVVRQPGGKPTLRLAGAALQIANGLGVKNISLTITHSGNLALAEVIFES